MEDQHCDDPDPLDLSFPKSEVDFNNPKFSQSQAAISIRSNPCASADAVRKTKATSPKIGHKKGGRKHSRASVLAEGQRGKTVGSESSTVSCERRLPHSGCTPEIGLAEVNSSEASIAMERASSYNSDNEWDEGSDLSSDTDGDHTDSSDDDDPKSQVDRLIEKGTLMYMDGENSALSSDYDSDDDSSDYDSESDITDVSPLISAAASPVGLSPVLPRRMVPTSPLALHDNSDIYLHHQNPFNWDIPHKVEPSTDIICDNHPPESQDSTNMKLLLQAVIELENQSRRKKSKLNQNVLPNITTNESLFINAIRDNPHHTHLNKKSQKRKNMSFSNDEVNKIDRENGILLKKLISAHTRHEPISNHHHRYHHKPSNSAVNRKRDEEKIQRENLLLLKKIQEVKPSKDVERAGPSFSTTMNCQNSVRSPTASCGASMRNLSQPSVRTPRKETAL